MTIFRFLKGINRYYFNIFLTILLSIVITLFVVSSVLYLVFERIGMSLINAYESRNLSKVSYSTTFMLDWTKALAYQIYQDRDIKKLLYDSSPEEDEKNISYMRIASYRNSTPHINSIYIYNGVSKNIYYDTINNSSYSTTDFYDKEIFDLVNEEPRVPHLLPVPRKIKSDSLNANINNIYNVYTFVFYEYPVRRLDKDNLIIINLSEDWMRNIIDSLDSNVDNNTFIIDSKGRTVISNGDVDMLTDLSSYNYIKQILESKSGSGYFTAEVNGIKSMVSFVSSQDQRVDWKYVSVIPYKTVTRKIDEIRSYTIIIGLCILFIGLAVTFYASGRLYKPIDNLLGDLKKLQDENQGSLHALKQEYFRNILKSGSQYYTSMLTGRNADFRMNLDISKPLSGILFKIDNYSEFCSRYNPADRSLFRFAIINITEELFSGQYSCECIDMESDHIVVLLNSASGTEAGICENISAIVKNIQASVKEYMQISLTAVIGSQKGTSVSNLPGLYAELQDKANYRMYTGHGSLIFAEKLAVKSADEYIYPMRKEESLINALMLKKNSEVKSILDEIISYAKEYHYSALTSTLLRLTLSINAAIDTLEKNSGIRISYNFNKFISDVNRLETVEEISRHFCSMFDAIHAKMTLRKSSSHEELVAGILDRINSDYHNPNLSIDLIASEYGMSPVYLGRIFKQNTLKSVSEYINDVRLEKAKSLLATTDDTINVIAEAVGFSNTNYFYTLFRKVNGLTPSEYRELNQQA